MSAEPRAPGAGLRARLPRAVIALGATSFFTDVASEMSFPLLPVLLATLHASPAFLGLVEGVADAVSSLLKLASGELADRVHRKKPLVVVGYTLASLVRPLMGLSTAAWHVLLIRATDRVGKGIRSSPRDALIAGAAAPGQEGRAFGFHRAMDHAGAVVGPLVATGLLLAGMELRTVLMLSFVPGLLALGALFWVNEAPGRPAAKASMGARPALPPPLRRYLVVIGVFALGNASDAFLLLRATELGMAAAFVPVLWTVLHVSKLVWAALGGGLADRFPRRRLIALGWVVYALSYLGLALATTEWHVWALFVVYGAYYGLTEPAEKALVKELAPEAVRGRAYGAYNFVVGILVLPAGLVTGLLWEEWGSRWALGTGASLALVAGALLVALDRGAPQTGRSGGGSGPSTTTLPQQ